MFTGTPAVRPPTFDCWSKDGMAVLEIEDDGKGIHPELLEELCQEWMGGLGIGVRGMNERMRQLGGRLELASNDDGTTVTAKVPQGNSHQPSELIR